MSLLLVSIAIALALGAVMFVFTADGIDDIVAGSIAIAGGTYVGVTVAQPIVLDVIQSTAMAFLVLGPFAIVIIPGIGIVTGLLSGYLAVRLV